MQAVLGGKCPKILKATTVRTVPSVVEDTIAGRVAPIVAEVAGRHVEPQLSDVFTSPDESALKVSFINLTGFVLERRLLVLAVSGAVRGDPGVCWAVRPAEV